jgi:hypothetical protein
VRIVYQYPDEFETGDEFVVEHVDLGPEEVTITLTPHRAPEPRGQEELGHLLRCANALFEATTGEVDDGVLYLARQAYFGAHHAYHREVER